MKKFLAKIVLFSIVSLMLTTLASPISLAQPTTEMDKEEALEDFLEIPAQKLEELVEEIKAHEEDNDDEQDEFFDEKDEMKELEKELEEELKEATADKATATTLAKLKELEALGDILKDEPPCIELTKKDGSSGDDANYIITIIEEPLSFEEEGRRGDDYQSRTCVRNYFSFTGSDGKEHSTVELLKDCSDRIKNINTTYSTATIKEYNIKYSCQPVQVLLSKGGLSLIEGYIGTFYRWAAGIVGIIAVLVIILSGIQISAAGGDTQAVENAKSRITKSIAGIVVLFLSGLILYTINPTFFVK